MYLRKLLVVAAYSRVLTGMIVGVLLGAAVAATQIYPEIKSIRYTVEGQPEQAATLPFKASETGALAAQHITFQMVLEYQTGQTAHFQFRLLQCIESIFVNGEKVVPLKSRTKNFCHYYYRTNLNLSPYLQPGENRIEFQLLAPQRNLDFNFFPIIGPQQQWIFRLILVCIMALGLQLFFAGLFRSHTPLELKLTGPRRELIWLVFLCCAPLVFYLRYHYWPVISHDFYYMLDEWYAFIRKHGMDAYSKPFNNYAPFYSYLLGATLWLAPWINNLGAIKLVSFIGDMAAAIFAFKLVRLYHPTSLLMPVLASIALLLCPLVLINSTLWGQCDIWYTLFLLACLYYLVRERHLIAMVCWGLAFAFKMQALFIAPFIGILLLRGRLPWSYLLLVPAMYLWLILPTLWLGRDIEDLLTIYWQQYNLYDWLGIAPNIYLFLPMEWTREVNYLALGIAFTAAGYLVRLGMQYQRDFDLIQILLLATIASMLLPLLLPRMHDRYIFPPVIFTLLLAFCQPRFVVPALLLQLSIFCYPYSFVPNIFGLAELPRRALGFILVHISFIWLCVCWWKDQHKALPTASPEASTGNFP